MRKKRSKHKGHDHPTLINPSPIDACGWCLNWIPEAEEPGLQPVTFDDGGDLAPGEVRDLVIDGKMVFAFAPESPFYEVMVKTGAHAVVSLCSEECAAAIALAMAKDLARRRGEDVPERLASDEERRDAVALLKEHCAWCLAPIADDAPIETVTAALTGEIESDDEMISLDIGGRKIPAVVPPPGFPMPKGHQVLFVLCSRECAAAIGALVTHA